MGLIVWMVVLVVRLHQQTRTRPDVARLGLACPGSARQGIHQGDQQASGVQAPDSHQTSENNNHHNTTGETP